jgi:8-oxo-dGTP pyrophosphatase MutT (NUDIX family)/protein-tyrosine-phosphatase
VKIISSYAKTLADQHKLRHGITKQHTQTTDKLLAESDVIVFMNKDVYDEALKRFDFDIRKCLVWHIPDIEKKAVRKTSEKDVEELFLEEATRTYKKIVRHCNDLRKYLTHTAWVDVVDVKNEPIGLRLPMAWATDRGLWHRGVHIIAQTVDGKYVVEKRSKDIIFAPGMLDVSLGGGVDSGEHPLRAAARETHEELGVLVPEKHFRPLFMYRQIGYHPRYNKQTRCHVYVYSVKLPVHSSALKPQLEEVAELRTLTRSQVKRLLHAHRIRHFGRLSWSYRLYDKAIAYSSLPL